jgi:choice-of-anchor C domain-containing protein
MGGICSIITVFCLLVGTAANAAVIFAPVPLVNGDFETPMVTHPDGFIYLFAGDPTITGWTITGNSVDLKGSIWAAQNGAQSVDLSGITAGGIYQDVATTPGQAYRLSFYMAGNPGIPGDRGPVVKTMNVSLGGAVLGTPTFDTTGSTFQDMRYVEKIFDFTATSATSRLAFDSLVSTPYGPVIDNVNLFEVRQIADPPAEVPLPPGVLAGLIGTGAAGVARRWWRK